MLWCRQLEDSYRNIAESYKECKERGWDDLIDDDMLKIVAEGGYIHDNGLKGVEKGYKPYYDYLKYENQGGDNNIISKSLQKLVYEEIDKVLYNKGVYSKIAENYKNLKVDGIEPSEDIKKYTAIGGYIHDNGFEGSRDNYKPYYEYINNYETPYSFEYEPYMIEFNHEVDTNNSIEMIEELYNEDNVEEDIDSDEIIDVLSFLTDKVKEVKKQLIHYISNYRPIMNQYTNTIETVLIE